MQIYIDESGNLGKDGPFFVLAYLIPKKLIRLKRIFKKACRVFGKPGSPLPETKASLLTFVQKQDLLRRMTSFDDFKCGYIVAQKDKIYPRLLDDKNITYNYLCTLLLEHLLRNATEDVEIVFDNHSKKVASTNSLSELIKIKAYTEWGYKGRLHIMYEDSCNHYQLQVVDLIANVIYGKYTYGKKKGLYDMLNPHFSHKERFPRASFQEIRPRIKPGKGA